MCGGECVTYIIESRGNVCVQLPKVQPKGH